MLYTVVSSLFIAPEALWKLPVYFLYVKHITVKYCRKADFNRVEVIYVFHLDGNSLILDSNLEKVKNFCLGKIYVTETAC